jgi:metallo-beta-lactamase family protein
MRLGFYGATRTVTGSKFLLVSNGKRILVDCGLFQGLKELRLRNWQAPPIKPASVDAIVLTHAHIDHTGYLPRFVKYGFRGPIYCTPATLDLLGILLPDAGYLQEEEARYRNLKRLSKHDPALPLYTIEDATASLKYLHALPYRTMKQLAPGLAFEFLPAGHILGSSFVKFHERNTADTTLLFTGDIGRYNQPIIHDPSAVDAADYLVLESTYGNRLHGDENGSSGKASLRDIVVQTARRGGTVLIPSFAIGRAQEVLYVLRELEDENLIPELPVYVDSPMAVDAFEVFHAHAEEHDLEMRRMKSAGINPLYTHNTRFVRSVEESKKINEHRFPSIIISANGMATGGRILHHLINRVADERNSIVFVGFQAAGTRGRTLVDGARHVRIFGIDYPVRAQVHAVDGFSAHGDYSEITRWLRGFKSAPRKTFLVHGEPNAIEGMKAQISQNFKGWRVEIPEYQQEFEL